MKKPIYGWIRRKQDKLKKRTDRRYSGLWMGPAPELLDGASLIPGDVLFCGKNSQDRLTQLIQNTTDGVYVHCGVYVGDDKVVDAVGSGVREISLEAFVASYAYVAVTRSPGVDPETSAKVVEFALRCVESKFQYNFLGAALAPLREYLSIRRRYGLTRNNISKLRSVLKISKRSRKRYFCSEFVVQCYIECGQNYHGNDEAGSWSPTGLAEESRFELMGFMSPNGLASVDPNDPHLQGNGWVLTLEGQELLRERHRQRMAKIEKIRGETANEEV